MYTYVHYRYGEKLISKYKRLDNALESAWLDLKFGESWPESIAKDGQVLRTNAGGFPLRDGSCPLNDFLHKWGERRDRRNTRISHQTPRSGE